MNSKGKVVQTKLGSMTAEQLGKETDSAPKKRANHGPRECRVAATYAGVSGLGKLPLAFVFVQSTGAEHLKAVCCKNVRGTRGTFPAVSGGQDEPVFGYLVQPLFQLV